MENHKSYCCNGDVFIGGRNGGRTLRVYCFLCGKLQDTYRNGIGKNCCDDKTLSEKFDALVEYLDVEFVTEKFHAVSKTTPPHTS